MAEEGSKPLPADHLQWRFYFIPGYSEDESVVVLKISHALGDGIAIIMMIAHLADNPILRQYPSLMNPKDFL